MASHDLRDTKTTILGATPGANPGIDGNPHARFSLDPAFSERFFKNWGGPRAPELGPLSANISFTYPKQISILQGCQTTHRQSAKLSAKIMLNCTTWRRPEQSLIEDY